MKKPSIVEYLKYHFPNIKDPDKLAVRLEELSCYAGFDPLVCLSKANAHRAVVRPNYKNWSRYLLNWFKREANKGARDEYEKKKNRFFDEDNQDRV